MIVVPAPTPVTIPLAAPIVATAGVLLVQVPPPDASDNVIVLPLQTLVEPNIALGPATTVTADVEEQEPTV